MDGLVISAKIRCWIQLLKMNGCDCREKGVEQGGVAASPAAFSHQIQRFCHPPEITAAPSSVQAQLSQPTQAAHTAQIQPLNSAVPSPSGNSKQNSSFYFGKKLVNQPHQCKILQVSPGLRSISPRAHTPAMQPPPGCSTPCNPRLLQQGQD